MNPQPFCTYTLLDELGHGGMGTVYRASGVNGQIVAIKVLAPHLQRDKGLLERFKREPKLMPKHPNIVAVLDVGECDGQPFFAMDYVEGESLEKVLRRVKRLALEQLMPVVSSIAAGLDAAHAKGVVHRDLKPANVLIRNDGHVFLTDFGVAKSLHGTQLTELSGGRIGTTHYMSPEQARGSRDITGASDVYALGVITFLALGGKLPFDADSDVVIARMHMQDAPPQLHQVNPIVPKPIARVVMRALNKAPNNRYGSAGEFARALEKALLASQRLPTPWRRAPVIGAVVGLVALLMLAFVVMQLVSSRNRVISAGNAASATPLVQPVVAVERPTATLVPLPTATDIPIATETVALLPTDTPEPLIQTATPLIAKATEILATSAPEKPTSTLVPPTTTYTPAPTRPPNTRTPKPAIPRAPRATPTIQVVQVATVAPATTSPQQTQPTSEPPPQPTSRPPDPTSPPQPTNPPPSEEKPTPQPPDPTSPPQPTSPPPPEPTKPPVDPNGP